MTQVAENEEMSQALKPSAEIQKEEKESIGQIVKSPLVGTLLCSTGRRCRSVCENRG